MGLTVAPLIWLSCVRCSTNMIAEAVDGFKARSSGNYTCNYNGLTDDLSQTVLIHYCYDVCEFV